MRSWTSIVLCSMAMCVAIIATPRRADANPSESAIVAMIAALSGWAAMHPDQVPSGGGTYTFSAGAVDRIDRGAQTWSLGFERRWGRFLIWRLKPFAGADITGRRSLYFYGGLRLDLHLISRLDVVPNFAVTNYLHGDGKHLGSPIDFRSGLDVEWRFADGTRLGIAYHHISHWIFFGSNNPGTEILALTFSIPVR